MLEAFGDYNTKATLIRELVQDAAYALTGSHTVTHADGTEYDLGGQRSEVTLYGVLSEAIGEEVTVETPMVKLCSTRTSTTSPGPRSGGRQAGRGAVRRTRRAATEAADVRT
jgi:lysyl-tRNA synthetase class II